MNAKHLTRQYIAEMEDSNYFGGLNGETGDRIRATREAWTNEMAELGWPLGTIVVDEDGDYVPGYDEACDEALRRAMMVAA